MEYETSDFVLELIPIEKFLEFYQHSQALTLFFWGYWVSEFVCDLCRMVIRLETTEFRVRISGFTLCWSF
jgi:hypothetical protein